jgi:hypothetical protein
MSEKSGGGPPPAIARVRLVAGRRRWRDAQAKIVVDAWQQSGLSMRAFAAQHGIHHKRLERWSGRLRREARPIARAEPAVQFLPVELATQEPAWPVATAVAGADMMEVRLPSGVSVSMRPGFDGPAFRRLLEALGC